MLLQNKRNQVSYSVEVCYTERFRAVSTSMAELKIRRERLKAIYQENEKASQRLQAISAALEGASADITEWDESTVYQLLEKVTVLSKDRIRVTFRSGLEIEQNIKEDSIHGIYNRRLPRKLPAVRPQVLPGAGNYGPG